MAGEGAEPLVSSLRQIFSQASISVTLTGLTEAERNRRIAFYDETLLVNIRLSIPASDETLPPPSSEEHASIFVLPIKAQGEDEDEIDDGRLSESPPHLLVLLLSSLQIFLDASYTAPRLSDPPPLNAEKISGADEAVLLSNHVAPASAKTDAAYQNIALQLASSSGEATQMFSNAWNASEVPPHVESGDRSRVGTVSEDNSQASACNAGEIAYVKQNGVGTWNVDWRCKLPVTFIKSRHPTPALLLTAGMTLRLQLSNLARLAPSLVRHLDSNTASESVFMHDLLNPLSEGPSYPDESPAERAARANASLAKLPLGKLPSAVIGSKLVTPARNAKEIGLLTAKRTAVDNGDMGDVRDNSNIRDFPRALTNEGLVTSDSGGNSHKGEQSKGDAGEDTIILQRSARKVLDVQSAIMVRMRTITVPNFNVENAFANSATLPALVLCVEVENPLNSGMEYALDKADVTVLSPTGPSCHPSNARKGIEFEIIMTRIGDVIEPLTISQGCQYNFLYRADFEVDMETIEGVQDITDSLNETLRNVSIKLRGKPVFFTNEEATSTASIDEFVSTWTCTLDFAPQMRLLGLMKLMENGAGSTSLRGSGENIKEPFERRLASTSTIVADKSQRMPSPYPRRSVSVNLSNDPRDRSPSSIYRPSLRVNSLTRDESFVSLNRSEVDQGGEMTSPALSSAAVGQSILARARMSRQQRDDSRQLLTDSPGIPDEPSQSAFTATAKERRVTSGVFSHRRAKTNSISLETDVNALLPLNDKRSGATIQRLLINPLDEQGLLLDVVAITPAQGELDTPEMKRVKVQVQIENRSRDERTVYLNWRRRANTKADDNEGTLQSQTILFDDDDVQVGPIRGQNSDIVTLDLQFTKQGLHTLPPLGVYEASTGMERVLHGLQTIVV